MIRCPECGQYYSPPIPGVVTLSHICREEQVGSRSETNMYRQGDVLLVSTEKTVGETTAQHQKILAYGEVTGHKHLLRGDVTFFEEDTLLVGPEGADLVHEEHAQLEIPAGAYKVILQREFDILEGVRQVMD